MAETIAMLAIRYSMEVHVVILAKDCLYQTELVNYHLCILEVIRFGMQSVRYRVDWMMNFILLYQYCSMRAVEGIGAVRANPILKPRL